VSDNLFPNRAQVKAGATGGVQPPLERQRAPDQPVAAPQVEPNAMLTERA
jgi:hypothetical protein